MKELLFKLMMGGGSPTSGIPGNDPTGGSNWKLDTFFSNLFSSIENWGSAIIMIIGLVLIIVGIVKIAQGLMSGGRGQTNWVLAIGMILLGGVLALTSSWKLFREIGKGAKDTLDGMGGSDTGMILPMLRAMLPF